MMTALSQAEDRERADKLGADKYLVKSQVTLDDVARTVNEIVQGSASITTPVEPVSDPTNSTTPNPVTTDEATKIAVSTEPSTATAAVATDDEQAKISSQIDEFLRKNASTESTTPSDKTAYDEAIAFHPPEEPATQGSQKVVSPIVDVSAPKPNIFDLYEKELAKEAEAAKPEQPKVEG